MSRSKIRYGTGAAPFDLQETGRRLAVALGWDEKAPRERFEISFRSPWKECGEAMIELSRRGADDMSWTHESGRHAVKFTSTFEECKSVQENLCRMQVFDLKCRRLLTPGNGIEGAS